MGGSSNKQVSVAVQFLQATTPHVAKITSTQIQWKYWIYRTWWPQAARPSCQVPWINCL